MLGIRFNKTKGYLLGTAMGLSCLVLLTPAAHATTINSTDGFCCFSVTLNQTDADDVFVSVALTNGATLFANTGNGTNHPGFAFNLAGAITATNIVSPTDLSTFHIGPDATNGPSFGTFDYFFDIPGNGTSGNDAGPLTFTVHRSTGVLISDFGANSDGFSFAADICEATTSDSCTGMSAISGTPSTPTPEPVSLSLVGGGLLALGFLRKRLPQR
jgi:hypothetical protein